MHYVERDDLSQSLPLSSFFVLSAPPFLFLTPFPFFAVQMPFLFLIQVPFLFILQEPFFFSSTSLSKLYSKCPSFFVPSTLPFLFKVPFLFCCLESLAERRIKLCTKFAKKALGNEKHSHWFTRNMKKVNTRSKPDLLKMPRYRCERFRRSPIPYLTSLLNSL